MREKGFLMLISYIILGLISFGALGFCLYKTIHRVPANYAYIVTRGRPGKERHRVHYEGWLFIAPFLDRVTSKFPLTDIYYRSPHPMEAEIREDKTVRFYYSLTYKITDPEKYRAYLNHNDAQWDTQYLVIKAARRVLAPLTTREIVELFHYGAPYNLLRNAETEQILQLSTTWGITISCASFQAWESIYDVEQYNKKHPLPTQLKTISYTFSEWLKDETVLKLLWETIGIQAENIEFNIGVDHIDIIAFEPNYKKKIMVESQLVETSDNCCDKIVDFSYKYDTDINIWLTGRAMQKHIDSLSELNTLSNTQYCLCEVSVTDGGQVMFDVKVKPDYKLL
jgi:hypothetical protein